MLYLLAANSLKCSISVYCLFMLHVDLTWGRWQTLCGRCGEGKVWGNLWKCGRLPSPSSERPETPHYHRRHQCISPAHRLTTLRTAGRTDGRPTLWPVHGPEGEGGVHRHTLYMPFLHKKLLMSSCFTFLCSEIRKRISNSRWLLAAAASRDGAQRGGTGGKEVVEPGAQTDFRASSLIAFHRDGFWTERMAFIIYSTDFLTIYIHKTSTWKSKTQRSTASDGWQLAKKVWWLKTQPTVL